MTTRYIELTDTYQQVAQGACLISPHNIHPWEIQLHIGNQAPDADTKAYHPVTSDVSYSGTESVYLMCEHGQLAVAVTEVK